MPPMHRFPALSTVRIVRMGFNLYASTAPMQSSSVRFCATDVDASAAPCPWFTVFSFRLRHPTDSSYDLTLLAEVLTPQRDALRSRSAVGVVRLVDDALETTEWTELIQKRTIDRFELAEDGRLAVQIDNDLEHACIQPFVGLQPAPLSSYQVTDTGVNSTAGALSTTVQPSHTVPRRSFISLSSRVSRVTKIAGSRHGGGSITMLIPR
jgi:hypothetical protein